MKLQIYYRHITGDVDHVGETDDPEDWVFNNNAERWDRVACDDPDSDEHVDRECSCIEDVDDFEFRWERSPCSRCHGEMRIKDYENGTTYSEDGMMPCPQCEGEG